MKMIDWKNYITTNPEVLFGKPTLKNTRIAVDLILEKLAFGDNIDDILNSYSSLTKDDIVACLLFAAETIKNEIHIPRAS